MKACGATQQLVRFIEVFSDAAMKEKHSRIFTAQTQRSPNMTFHLVKTLLNESG